MLYPMATNKTIALPVSGISPQVRLMLLNYINGGVKPTSRGICAILENDLMGVIDCFGKEHMDEALAIAAYIHKHMPAITWGSKQRMKHWAIKFGKAA